MRTMVPFFPFFLFITALQVLFGLRIFGLGWMRALVTLPSLNLGNYHLFCACVLNIVDKEEILFFFIHCLYVICEKNIKLDLG